MAKVFRCSDCGNVTRFDKNGDGRCDECGEIMEKIEEKKLSEEDKIVLLDKDGSGEGRDKVIDLERRDKDILE